MAKWYGDYDETVMVAVMDLFESGDINMGYDVDFKDPDDYIDFLMDQVIALNEQDPNTLGTSDNAEAKRRFIKDINSEYSKSSEVLDSDYDGKAEKALRQAIFGDWVAWDKICSENCVFNAVYGNLNSGYEQPWFEGIPFADVFEEDGY